MRILALETSSRHPNVALFDNGQIVSQSELKTDPNALKPQRGAHSSSSLLVDIQMLFAGLDWAVRDVDVIACVTGPGSFTGLRIGVVTAKTLAYLTNAKIIGINALEAVAWQARHSAATTILPTQVLRVVINAQRSQLFCAEFGVNNSGVAQLGESRILDRDQWLSEIQPGDIVSGLGLGPIVSAVSDLPDVTILPKQIWAPTAITVGEMAQAMAKIEAFDDLWTINPIYFRPSYAEE